MQREVNTDSAHRIIQILDTVTTFSIKPMFLLNVNYPHAKKL